MVTNDIWIIASLFSSMTFRFFDFTNDKRGTIELKGNMLFTHFSEINPPKISFPSGIGGFGLDAPVENLPHTNFSDETLNSAKL